MSVTLSINVNDLATLRDDLGHILTNSMPAIKRDAKVISELAKDSMVKEINRFGLNWNGDLLESVLRVNTKEGKNKVLFYWGIPDYAVWMDDLRRSYWAPTFVEGNTVSGPFKENIKYLERWRKEKGLTKEQLPFIRVRPRPWLKIAFLNFDGELDNYLNGKTEFDTEIINIFSRINKPRGE